MTDRKAIAAAFRAAKPLLWDGVGGEIPFGKTRFICFAIRLAATKSHWAAEEVISKRIGGKYSSMAVWLSYQDISNSSMTDARLQAHRHAWPDMLIAEFERDEQ
jgi:hypothetical protein